MNIPIFPLIRSALISAVPIAISIR